MRSLCLAGVFVVVLAMVSGCSRESSPAGQVSSSASSAARGEADCEVAQQQVAEAAKPGLGLHAEGTEALNAKAVKALVEVVKIMDASPEAYRVLLTA